MKIQAPMWKNRVILDESHAGDLESRAAIHQFTNKMDSEAADEAAHLDYKKDHHRQAAAKHFVGMKAARASADNEEARKHFIMFNLHMKALGLNPNAALPSEIESHITNTKEPFYRFSPHKADAFLFAKSEIDGYEVLGKGWPKDEVENDVNANAHKVIEDHMYEQGAKRKATVGPSKKTIASNDARLSWEAGVGTPGIHTGNSWYPRDHSKYDREVENELWREASDPLSPPQTSDEISVNKWNTKGAITDMKYGVSSPFAKRSPILKRKRVNKSEGLGKGWPKDESENEQNAHTHNVLEDLMHELGATKETHEEGNPAAKLPLHSQLSPSQDDEGSGRALGALMDNNNSGGGGPNPSDSFGPGYFYNPQLSQFHSNQIGTKDRPVTPTDKIYEKRFWEPLAEPTQKAAIPESGSANLHSDINSFMTGLKTLPKGSAERGNYITQHMSHGPFISALQTHPQGKQIHAMLTGFLNSKQNAGTSSLKVTVR